MKIDKSTGTAKVPSLSREIEQLSILILNIFCNIPNEFLLRKKVEKIGDEIDNAMLASNLAYNEPSVLGKYSLLLSLSMHLALVGQLMGTLYEWSSNNKRNLHIISQVEFSKYLYLNEKIDSQFRKWFSSVRKSAIENFGEDEVKNISISFG